MAAIDSGIIVAFGALIGGLVAYLAGFALLQTTRRRPPLPRGKSDLGAAHDPAAADRGAEDLPMARRLLESTPV